MVAALFDGLFPAGVALAWEHSDAPEPPLFTEEEPFIAKAVPKRRREFAHGRACARRALAELGVAPVALLAAPTREPCWPSGTVGSITHDRALCVAVAARADAFAGVGIDVEPDEPLESGVAARIWSSEEAEAARVSAVLPFESAAKLVFSVKEAVYKCQYQLTQTFIGFGAVSVRLANGTFDATLIDRVGALPRGHRFSGTWRRAAGELVAASWLARSSSE